MRTRTVFSALALGAVIAGCGSHSTAAQPAAAPTAETTTASAATTPVSAVALDSAGYEACRAVAQAQTSSPPPDGQTTKADTDYQTLTLRADITVMRSKTPGFARSWMALPDTPGSFTTLPELQMRRTLCGEYGFVDAGPHLTSTGVQS